MHAFTGAVRFTYLVKKLVIAPFSASNMSFRSLILAYCSHPLRVSGRCRGPVWTFMICVPILHTCDAISVLSAQHNSSPSHKYISQFSGTKILHGARSHISSIHYTCVIGPREN